MDELQIFTLALGLEAPWHIEALQFEPTDSGKVLHITVGHEKRTQFAYEDQSYAVYDHQERTWRHLDFFEHECYLHARVPRVKTSSGQVKLVEVPWAKPGSSFTLLFEVKVRHLVEDGLSLSRAGKQMRITDKRVGGIIVRCVSHALATQALETVKQLGIDETSTHKGHHYLTVLSDHEAKKVVGLALGKDKQAVANALVDMEVRGAYREKVRLITMDMSTSYIAAAADYMEQAQITFDRFHISKLLNAAIDQIRRQEQQQYRELKKSRYLWLKHPNKLKDKQQERLHYLTEAYPTIGEAYRLKELFREVMDQAQQDYRLKPLNEWMKHAWNSGLAPIQGFVNMLKDHWYGIKTYFRSLATNAYAERVNLKIQEIKRTARGYRNMNNFMLMIYLHLGKLQFD